MAKAAPKQSPAAPVGCSYRWIILVTATVAQASASFVVQGLGAVAGFLQTAFSLGGSAVGLIVTAAALPPIAVMIAVGDALDRRNEASIILVGAITTGIGAAIAALATNYLLVLVGLLVVGVGYSTAQPGGSRAVAYWFCRSRRGFAMGVRQAGLPIGGALAAAALPIIASTWGWRWAFAAAAVVAMSGGLLFGLSYRRPPGGSPTSASGNECTALPRRIAHTVQHKWMRPIIWSGVTLVTAQFAVQTYLMLFLRDNHHVPLTHGAWSLVLVQLLGVAGRIALGSISDNIHRPRLGLVLVSMLVTAGVTVSLPLLPVDTPAGVLYALTACLGFFAYGWYGPWVAHITESAEPSTTGLHLGAAMAINQVAIAATPPLLGLLRDLTGSYAAVWWPPAIALIIAAPAVFLSTRPHSDVATSGYATRH